MQAHFTYVSRVNNDFYKVSYLFLKEHYKLDNALDYPVYLSGT